MNLFTFSAYNHLTKALSVQKQIFVIQKELLNYKAVTFYDLLLFQYLKINCIWYVWKVPTYTRIIYNPLYKNKICINEIEYFEQATYPENLKFTPFDLQHWQRKLFCIMKWTQYVWSTIQSWSRNCFRCHNDNYWLKKDLWKTQFKNSQLLKLVLSWSCKWKDLTCQILVVKIDQFMIKIWMCKAFQRVHYKVTLY